MKFSQKSRSDTQHREAASSPTGPPQDDLKAFDAARALFTFTTRNPRYIRGRSLIMFFMLRDQKRFVIPVKKSAAKTGID